MRTCSIRRAAMVLMALYAAGCFAGEAVWLSDLDLGKARQGWGAPQKDRSVDGNLLTIAGKRFARGFGTHSPGSLTLDLKGGSERFTSNRWTAGIEENP